MDEGARAIIEEVSLSLHRLHQTAARIHGIQYGGEVIALALRTLSSDLDAAIEMDRATERKAETGEP